MTKLTRDQFFYYRNRFKRWKESGAPDNAEYLWLSNFEDQHGLHYKLIEELSYKYNIEEFQAMLND